MRPLLTLFVLLTLSGCSDAQSPARPVASATLDYFPARVWGTGNSVSPDLALSAGGYTPFIQAFDPANGNAPCPIQAVLKDKAQESFRWELGSGARPSTNLPGMLEGTPRALAAGTYLLEVDTACEWLVMVDWQP